MNEISTALCEITYPRLSHVVLTGLSLKVKEIKSFDFWWNESRLGIVNHEFQCKIPHLICNGMLSEPFHFHGVTQWRIKSSVVRQSKIYKCNLALKGVKGLMPNPQIKFYLVVLRRSNVVCICEEVLFCIYFILFFYFTSVLLL